MYIQTRNLVLPLFASVILTVVLALAQASLAQDTTPPVATASDGSSTNSPTLNMGVRQGSADTNSSNEIYQPPIRQGSVSAADLEADKYRKPRRSIIGSLVKGVGKGLGGSVENMGKDAAFVFSNRDIDWNQSSPPSNKPYQEYHIRWSDGTRSNIVRYPDGKRVITSGYRTGTVITPVDRNTLDIQYPNSHHSTARATENGGYVISRYDGKTFRLSPKISGGYYITGPDGEMGSILPSVVDTHYGYYSMRDSMDF
jgi:hypothetical protein